ncbi:hypothetical protein OAP94_00415 [bacterium]|nr:hypothetical protein [bacterium]MDC1007125.1 hypothetical protein [bacterium]
MAQLGRISGQVLTNNLERNGIDLDFRNLSGSTPLIKLNVTSSKIGVNTTSPAFDLDVNNTIRGNFLNTSSLSPGNFTISNNDINALTGSVNFKNDVVSSGIATQQLMFRDNTISSYVTNADVNFLPNGTGTIELQANTNVTGNVSATGNITFDGNLIFGNDVSEDTVTINADVTSDIVPDADSTYNLGSQLKDWDNINFDTMYVQSVLGNNISIEGGLVELTLRHGNIFYVDKNGDDSNVGDHPNGAFLTLTRALSFADASIQGPVVIHINAGEYQEAFPLTVPTNVTIVGADIRNTIIKPTLATNTNNAFLLDGETTVENLTITDFFSPGYAFSFKSNAIVTSRSPYIRNVTVITKGSVTSASDLRGYDQGDAGKGVLVDGASVSSSSQEASMLFHSCTFITPGVESIKLTNGVRVEWLNSFVYFAQQGILLERGSTGHLSTDGSTIKYGAEMRCIGSANVYGEFGIKANGVGTNAYLINHNFTYIGTGKSTENDDTVTIPENEVVEINSGRVNYTTVDEQGNFRVGTALFVNQETGKTEIEAASIDFSNTDSLNVTTAGNTFFIDDTQVRSDFLRLRSNKLESLVGNLTIDSALNTVNITANTNITGNLTTSGNATITGAIVRLGDADSDEVVFTSDVASGMIPNVHASFDLGSTSKMWQTAYAEKLTTDEINIEGNNITTTSSDADLDLDPAGTGQVLFNEFTADQAFTQSGTNSTATAQINSTLGITGTLTVNSDTTLNNVITPTIQANGYANIGTTSFVGNRITTNDTNANLELKPAGTGAVKVPGNMLVENTIIAPTANYSFSNATMNSNSGERLITTNYNVENQIIGDVRIEGNVIDTLSSNTDLEFRANGTGKVIIQENVDALNVNVDATTAVSTANVTTNTHATNITVNTFSTKDTNIESISIIQNRIDTVVSDADLDLRASGTGTVSLQEHVDVTNDVNVQGSTNLNATTVANGLSALQVTTGKLTTGSTTIEGINLFGNSIDTNGVDTDLQLSASGTGRVSLGEDVIVTNDLTADNITFDALTITASELANLQVTGNKIISNTQMVIGDIAIDGNAISTHVTNADLEFRANQTGKVRLQENVNVTNNFTVNGTLTAYNIGIEGDVDLSELETDGNIEFNDNYVTTTVSDSDLELRTSGVGFLDLQGIKVRENVIQSSSSADILLDPTDVLEVNGTGSVVLPNSSVSGSPDTEYNNGAFSNVTGDGSDFFKREVTVNGVRIVAAGTVGGQTAVPDSFVEKVARMFELFLDKDATGINESAQRTVIKTLSGDAGTYHAAVGPTLQRVARGAGADYTPNFLTDAGIASYNLSPLFDSHVANDMVWYLNSTGDAPGDGDNDAQEVIEHVFHTLHMHGLDAVSLKMYPYISADWATGPLYAAMEEAYDAGKWDSSGYGGNAWKTDGDAFEVAAKEYLFLLNFGMFEYSSLWSGGSLAPEWTDDMRTQSGIQANNPLGYALHNTYIAPVISKPSLTTIRSIFQDGDTGNPTLAGASGYVVDNYTPVFSNNIGAVQYNSDINQIVGLTNSVKRVLGGLYSDDYQTFVRPNSDNTINFTTQGVNVATMSYQATTLNRLELGGIDIDGNTIQTNTTNSDLILAPESGQGKVQFENLHFLDNTITNTSNGAALFNVTGDGYIKLNQPTAFVIPAGSSVQRPSNPQVGEIRRNSDLDYLEVYTVGGIWSDASGSGETVSEDEMNNIMNEYILIFG